MAALINSIRGITAFHTAPIRIGPIGWLRFCFSTSPVPREQYRVVVLGGGTGGCATASRLASKLGRDQVAVLEPADWHYYRPMWTLVGAGIKNFHQSGRLMKNVLPRNATWIKEKVVAIEPEKCLVTTDQGRQIAYEYLVCALGIQVNLHQIPGLEEALRSDTQVVSNYLKESVIKTRQGLDAIQEGNALFTLPNTPINCTGAAQKIMYLAEHLFRKQGKRDKIKIIFNTSLPNMFGVEKYRKLLNSIVEERDISVNFRHNLVEIFPARREAMFENLDSGKRVKLEYNFLHVTPPMSAPDVIRSCTSLVDENGWLDVDMETMQSVHYPNVFGTGDNINVPTVKTAAAIPEQSATVSENIIRMINGRSDMLKGYSGYTSCPLVTQYGKCVMAEFKYGCIPVETFPFNQAKERRTMYLLKKEVLPRLYWFTHLPGYWNGSKKLRNFLHIGQRKKLESSEDN